jgi:hypothetical protein
MLRVKTVSSSKFGWDDYIRLTPHPGLQHGFLKAKIEAQFSHELREGHEFFRAFRDIRGRLGGPALGSTDFEKTRLSVKIPVKTLLTASAGVGKLRTLNLILRKGVCFLFSKFAPVVVFHQVA